MRYYELLYIVNPNLEDDKVNNIIDKIGNEINKSKVSIINHYLWGKKRLAYPIKNNKYGTYILLQFSSEKFDFLMEFERSLILNKSVIRHQLVRLDEEPEKVENVEAIVEKDDLPKEESSEKPEEDSKTENIEADKIETTEEVEKVKKTEKAEDAKGAETVDDSDTEKSESEKEIEVEKKEDDK
jgi:small subunit ribosomal protein S6